jgi:hypothetical protein
MTALVTNESPMRERRQPPKLIIFDAVRAANYRHIHCGVHVIPPLLAGIVSGWILPVNGYRNVNSHALTLMWGTESRMRIERGVRSPDRHAGFSYWNL